MCHKSLFVLTEGSSDYKCKRRSLTEWFFYGNAVKNLVRTSIVQNVWKSMATVDSLFPDSHPENLSCTSAALECISPSLCRPLSSPGRAVLPPSLVTPGDPSRRWLLLSPWQLSINRTDSWRERVTIITKNWDTPELKAFYIKLI